MDVTDAKPVANGSAPATAAVAAPAAVEAKPPPRLSRAEKLLDAKIDGQIDKMVRSLGSSGATAEQKVLILAKQLVESEREANRRATLAKQNEKGLEQVQREKENLQKEYNKGVLMRDKLEQVCREQQKLMKSIKSECTSRIREEEEKRKETQAHFQKSINDIFTTLGKNNEENAKLKEANLEMTKKFKFLAEQYELREQQLGKINEQIQLEAQLNEAKLAKTKMEATIEKEILLKEKEAILIDLMSTKKAIIDMQGREVGLKDQLNTYTTKYAEFQQSLQKSNNVFSSYKTEIDSMGKRTKTLEKESFEWRIKYDKCNRALLNMASDKQEQDAYVAKSARQVAQLQKLCRTLQAERGSLLDALSANGIERPAMPELPPAPTDIEPPPRPADKLDAMSRNCNDLKQSLAVLQGQMKALEAADAAKPAAAAKKEATKKPKNKKPKAKQQAAAQAATPVTTNPADETAVQTNGTADATAAAAATNGNASATESAPAVSSASPSPTPSAAGDSSANDSIAEAPIETDSNGSSDASADVAAVADQLNGINLQAVAEPAVPAVVA